MKAFAVGGLIACLASLPALADCVEPQSVTQLPDGATANREEMVSAMQALQLYAAAVNEFMECAQKSSYSQLPQANRAIDNARAIANKFNAQLRVFKKRTGE
jgi:hypothetical protein